MKNYKAIQQQYVFWLDTLGYSKPTIRKYSSKAKELFEWLITQNINHINQLQLIFALYYGCGLRLNEGYNLTQEDINFNKRTIFIRQGKNYKDRIIPINDSIYKALQDYIYNFRNFIKCNHNRLFIHSSVALLNSLKDLQSLCKNQEIQEKRLHFHILRHSIATHLLEAGMSIDNIARFLGHSTLTSTQVYTHISNRTI